MPRPRTSPGNPKLAISVLRVSTDEQALSPAAQREAITKWAHEHSVEIVAEHSDIGVSGTAPIEQRPGLLAAIEDLRERGAGLLIVAKRDRLARSVITAAITERLVEGAGARIASADGTSDEDTPDAWLMRTIKDAFAEYECLLIRARTKAALAVLKSQGRRLGGVPYGWEPAPDDRDRLVPNEREQRIIGDAHDLREKGLSLRAVGAQLAELGHLPRSSSRWHPQLVKRLLEAPRSSNH